MKLTIGLSAALASFAAAAQQAAEQAANVYILRGSHPGSSTTGLTPNEARLILQQRLAPEGEGPSFRDVPTAGDQDRIVSLMNKYGKANAPLFTEDKKTPPHQLVVVVEGMTGFEYEPYFAWFLHTQPDFTVSSAEKKLEQNNFYNLPTAKKQACPLSKVVALEKKCWNGKSTVVTYDRSQVFKKLCYLTLNYFSNLAQDSDSPVAFWAEFPKLQKLAESGEMETTFVFLPDGSDTKMETHEQQELRRRQAETVMTSADDNVESPAQTSSIADNPVFSSVPSVVPSCFKSEDSCIKGTANCTGHGMCQNKFAKRDGADGKEACFTCHCLSTIGEKGGVTHWAGGACSKQDISVQFWLFAGFTIAMVTILYLAIGMLFSVGEEKLPGVIGAGVSRSK
ncbi:endoplasmic reticulum membrane [Fusarium albosuccineum]|uniref:Endoplasmic reticulum membrane n=1 Tax=Fusarium albosuccineum TaxID=1237068 RepID=A0A8H4LE84_9HYPO|nr:endoplasmic reticulum membrane [Fusarium albosuccineum]